MKRIALFPLALCVLAVGCPSSKDDTSKDDTTGHPMADADGDTITDLDEGTEDPDGDGTGNDQDDDSDGDAIPDGTEAGDEDPATPPVDSDADGTPDFLDTDSDGNGLSDMDEVGPDPSRPVDNDGDGIADFVDPDNDGDGIPDLTEGVSAESPADTDGDGVPDYMDPDTDDDGVGDLWEAGPDPADPEDTDQDGTPDFRDTDSDEDGLPDSAESGTDQPGTEPQDTDGDGAYDFRDTDSDGDGLSDAEETVEHGTRPLVVDSDADGQTDGAEVLGGSDPMDRDSSLPYYLTVGASGSASLDIAVSPSVHRVDLAFLLDTTATMSSSADALTADFKEIAEGLADLVSDPAFAFSTYEDMSCCGMGASEDTPFRLQQQVTTDQDLAQTAISAHEIHYGNDATESGMEALYQSLTGVGFDLECDGAYTEYDDVLPFVAAATDVFGGTVPGSGDPATEGTGTLGGMGFREGAVPILVYLTDNFMRDGEADFKITGTACHEAGHTDVVESALALGAYLLGVACSPVPRAQMEALANATGSLADLDGDGSADPLVLHWDASGLHADLMPLLEALVKELTFGSVSLVTTSEAAALTVTVDPSRVEAPFGEEPVTFTLTVESEREPSYGWTYETVHVEVLGDDAVSLEAWDLVVAFEPTL